MSIIDAEIQRGALPALEYIELTGGEEGGEGLSNGGRVQ